MCSYDLYTLPSIIGMLFFSVYIVIDGIFVGQMAGGAALAAINIAMPFFSIMMAISLMLSAGANTIVGIELGQGDKEKARRTYCLALYTLAILSTTVTILTLIFINPICRMLGATDELLPMVRSYLILLAIFTPFFTTGGLLSNGLRTIGRPNYAMMCTIVGSVLNIILDYILVVVFDLHVIGAGLATGIAFTISCFIGIIPYFSKKCLLHFTTCKVDFKKILKFFYNGSSEALTEVAVAYTTFLFNMVLLKNLGETGVATFSIITYVTALVIAVLIGISTEIGRAHV